MTTYTVIGAGGFVGSHVVAALRAQGIEPFLPERDDPALWQRDLGHVFYCAGLTGDYRTRPFATVEAHVALLARLLEAARFDRIVYLSSTRLYDKAIGSSGGEDQSIAVDAGDPEHLYELSKLLGENLTLHRSGGRGAVARLSYVFGWDEAAQGFLSDWLRMGRTGGALDIDSSPGLARDYIHVDDVVSALRILLDSDVTGIVNVARGEDIDNGRIAALFAAHGRPVRFSRDQPAPSPRPPIETRRLAALGFTARPVLPLIEDHLARSGRV